VKARVGGCLKIQNVSDFLDVFLVLAVIYLGQQLAFHSLMQGIKFLLNTKVVDGLSNKDKAVKINV
jgi:hypothetical protein